MADDGDGGAGYPPGGLTPAQMLASREQLEAAKAALESRLEAFWGEQLAEVQAASEFKNHLLPLARIKKIMKSDEDVRMISAEAPVLFAKACEMFILELTYRAWAQTEEAKRRTLQRSDISAAIQKTDIFDFLIDIVPRDEPKKDGLAPPGGGAALGMPAGAAALDGAAQMQQYYAAAAASAPGYPGGGGGDPAAMYAAAAAQNPGHMYGAQYASSMYQQAAAMNPQFMRMQQHAMMYGGGAPPQYAPPQYAAGAAGSAAGGAGAAQYGAAVGPGGGQPDAASVAAAAAAAAGATGPGAQGGGGE